jgi:hypothetical protein
LLLWKLVDRHGAGPHAVAVGPGCRAAAGRGLADELADDAGRVQSFYVLDAQLVTRTSAARPAAGALAPPDRPGRRRREAPPPLRT